jgi:hypothetical protein
VEQECFRTQEQADTSIKIEDFTCCQGLREGSSADISVRGPECQEGACEYLKSPLILTKSEDHDHCFDSLEWTYVSADHDHCFDSLEWTIYMLARIMTIVLTVWNGQSIC